ncbi:MFS permease [Bordetella trematum]|nr:MFS permease [Bordetella trematum]
MSSAQEKDVARRKMTIVASVVGTVIEWYDYMAYAFLALTIAKLFFAADQQGIALLSALAVFGCHSCSVPWVACCSATWPTAMAVGRP